MRKKREKNKARERRCWSKRGTERKISSLSQTLNARHGDLIIPAEIPPKPPPCTVSLVDHLSVLEYVLCILLKTSRCCPGTPGSPRFSGRPQGRENQPILPGSRGSPQSATPQGPQDSPLNSLDVLFERLRAATLQAMGQTTDQGERSERSGRDRREGRGGR